MHVIETPADVTFLSSLAQDFIEDGRTSTDGTRRRSFLSSLAQDFIEDLALASIHAWVQTFLSSVAQDFIEERRLAYWWCLPPSIPEFSSSGLH